MPTSPTKKSKAKAKPVAKTKAKAAETKRTKAPTISQREETPRTRAPTATDVRSQTRRTRAPTKSERDENPRTKAPTIRPGALADSARARRDTLRDAARGTSARAQSQTILDLSPAFDAAAESDADAGTDSFDSATTGRWHQQSLLEVAPARARSATLQESIIVVSAQDEVDGDVDDPVADPARALELASLESRIADLEDPEVLVAVASQIDKLGMQLAFEISRHAHDADHVAPLKPVLMRVPSIYGRALVRAAEKFDDRGSPKRAAYVLFEALRKAFDPALIASMMDALAFVLEAHEQGAAAVQLRALVIRREAQRAAGVDRKDVRTQFAAALEQLRDRAIDWTALTDEPPQFD
jgi:hypothetical protein